MSRRVGRFAALLASMALVALACDSGGCVATPTNPCSPSTGTTITTIEVSPLGDSILVGGTLQLTAVARDATGSAVGGATVTWASQNDGVATVSASGLVTGQAVGATTVTASAGGVSSLPSTIAVFAPVTIASVDVTPPNDSVAVGATVQLAAVARDSTGSVAGGVDFAWASSSEVVARVSASGLVTGQTAGTAQITATAGGVMGEATITILPQPMVVGSIPQNGDSAVSITDNLEFVFDHDMDPSTFNASTFFLTGPDGPVAGGFATIGPARRFIFLPDVPLTEFGTEYTLQVTTAVTDALGVPLAAPVSVTFTTEFVSPDFTYRIWNDFLGADLVLDTFSNSFECFFEDRALQTGGTFWFFVPLGDGVYQLRNQFGTDARQLEGTDGVGPCRLDPVGGFTGQRWTFTALGDERYRLQNVNFGSARSLAIYNDGRSPEQAFMAVTGTANTQSWALERANPR